MFIILLLLIGAWWLPITINRRINIKLKEKYFKQNGGLLVRQHERWSRKLFTKKELDKATGNFGVGRIRSLEILGTLYKGLLDGTVIVVKKS